MLLRDVAEACCSSGQCWLPPLLSCIAGWLHTCKNGLFSWWSLLAVWSSWWLSSIVSEEVVFVWNTDVIVWLKFFFVWQRSWSCYHFFLPVWTRCSHISYNQSLVHSSVFGRPCLNGGGTLLDISDPRQGLSLHLFFRCVEICEKTKQSTQVSCILMTTWSSLAHLNTSGAAFPSHQIFTYCSPSRPKHTRGIMSLFLSRPWAFYFMDQRVRHCITSSSLGSALLYKHEGRWRGLTK